MNVIPEEEHLTPPVVPPSIGGKHILVLPCIRTVSELRKVPVRLVRESCRLHKDGVSEHVHIVYKSEELYLGLVAPCLALDYLPVLVFHGAAAPEHGDTVLGVVVQIPGPEDIVVLVPELHHITAEFGKVPVYMVYHLFTLQFSLFLDYLHIADSVYYLRVDIPECGVADKVCIIMQESGRTGHLPETLSVHIQQLGFLGAYEYDNAVLRFFHRLLLGNGGNRKRRYQQNAIYQPLDKLHQHLLFYSPVLNFAYHPSRSKSQFLKRGSITIYVVFSFESMKSSTAFIDAFCFTCSERRL